MENTGLVHIYTGNGKGKTTSSVGLAVRALSQGLKVYYAVFNKNPDKYGTNETHTLQKLGATVKIVSGAHPSFNKTITKVEHAQKSLEGLNELISELDNADFQLLILDEILISVRDGFIEESVLLEFVKNKPKDLELVLTGRGATENLIKVADYVSEIKAVKHPMDKGIASRKGIEF